MNATHTTGLGPAHASARGRKATFWTRTRERWIPLFFFLTCLLTELACNAPSPFNKASSALILSPSTPSLELICPKPDPANSPFQDLLPPSPTAPVGALSGTFAVSSTGEATYTIPLQVPPGRAGMEPSLALTYNSASGDGQLGMGFSLSGFSVITRCPKTIAQDGEKRAVQDDDSDVYCLDGKRLILLGEGGDAREYRTFPDTFTKVVASFSPDEERERGPRSWQTFTPDGRILEYGKDPSGLVLGPEKVIRAWWVTSARDRHDNRIEYTYRNDRDTEGHTVEHAPQRINYTSHPDAKASRAVVFAYGSKPKSAQRSLFVRGARVHNSLQLEHITMLGPGDALVRRYDLVYDAGPGTGRARLRSVAECAPDHVCKPPTRFVWTENGKPRFDAIPTSVKAPQSPLASVLFLDATGDGLDDLLVIDSETAGGIETFTTLWNLYSNRKDLQKIPYFDGKSDTVLYQEHQQTPIPFQPEPGTAIDYNHDGRMDLLLHDIYNSYSNWHVLLAQPDHSFKFHSTHIPHVFPKGAPLPPGLASHDASAHLFDSDGDGMLDLLQCQSKTDHFEWTLRPWQPNTSYGPGFATQPLVLSVLQDLPCDLTMQPLDVDADGKTELLLPATKIIDVGNVYILDHYLALTQPSQGSFALRSLDLPFPGPKGRALFLDVNGDGLPDAIESGFSDHRLRTYLNTGRGFTGPEESLGPSAPIGPDADVYFAQAAVLDFDSDGQQDLLMPLSEAGHPPKLMILRSTGAMGKSTFEILDAHLPLDVTWKQSGFSLTDPRAPRIGDIDGDGATDVVLPNKGTMHLFRNPLGENDLLARVIDGNNRHEPSDPDLVPDLGITYTYLNDLTDTLNVTQGSPEQDALSYRAHTETGHACAYPIRCVVGPRRVVEIFLYNNGADQERLFRMAYRDGRYHRLGRGFLGFGEVITRDVKTGAGTIATFDNHTSLSLAGANDVFPYVGRPQATLRFTPDEYAASTIEWVHSSLTSHQWQTVKTYGERSYFVLSLVDREQRQQGLFAPGDKDLLTAEQFARASIQSPQMMLGHSWHWVETYDTFGTILSEFSGTVGIDEETHRTRTVEHDEQRWVLGKIENETTCSTAEKTTLCRSVDRTYTKSGQVKTEHFIEGDDPESELSIHFDRDAFGNVTWTTATDALQVERRACTSYDAEGIFPYAQRNAENHLRFSHFDPGSGVLRAAIDADGRVTRWEQDGLGRITKELRPDKTTSMQLWKRSKQSGAWKTTLTTTVSGYGTRVHEFDGRGRVIRWTEPGVGAGASAHRLEHSVEYDALGEHIQKRYLSAWEMPGSAAGPYYEEYRYDAMGRLVETISPWKARTSYQYLNTTVITRSPGGGLTRVEHDGRGRPIRVKDAENGETTYTYGPFGGLWKVTDPGGAVTITERDGRGRVRRLTDPDRGVTENHYSGFGELRSSTNALKQTTTLARDRLGRPLRQTDSDGVTTWTWDSAKNGTGQLASIQSPDGNLTSFTYTPEGRRFETTQTLEGEAFTTRMTYDAYGRPEVITYPQSSQAKAFAVRNVYDAAGHVIEVLDDHTQAPYWTLHEADRAGRTLHERFGNGVETFRAYDEAKNRVQSIRTARALAEVYQDLVYAYDERRNMQSRDDTLAKQGEVFAYDKLDRLTCVRQNGASACAQAMIYAPDGNLLSRSDVGAYTYDPEHPHAVVQAGAGMYRYNEVGDQVHRNGITIEYTAFHLPKRMVSAASGNELARFTYDGGGQRLRKTTPEAETVYLGGLYEREKNLTTGAVEHRYFVHTPERVVAVVKEGPSTGGTKRANYLHTDALGSVEVVTDEHGELVETRSYDAFGKRRAAPWDKAAPLPARAVTQGYTGHEDEEDLGLINMKGRLYDPTLGRFLTPDPFVTRPLDGQSWNRYSYVLNNPLSYTDPSGFDAAPADNAFPPPGYYHIEQSGGTVQVSATEDEIVIVGTAIEDEEEQPSLEALQAGATTTPVDLGTRGTVPGVTAPAAPTPGAWKTSGEIAGEVFHGSLRGLGELAVDMAKSTVLNIATAGLYGGYGFASSIWQGYQEDGVLGAVNVLNPLYGLGRLGADASMAAENGDYEDAAAAGVKVVVLTAAAVLGGIEEGAAIEGGAAGGGTTTPHYEGPRSAPARSSPNSIWETRYSNGNRRITYFDKNGISFSREDYGQQSRHIIVVEGNRVNLKNTPHEHQIRMVDGPKGPYPKNQVRTLDQNGYPTSGWVNEK